MNLKPTIYHIWYNGPDEYGQISQAVVISYFKRTVREWFIGRLAYGRLSYRPPVRPEHIQCEIIGTAEKNLDIGVEYSVVVADYTTD